MIKQFNNITGKWEDVTGEPGTTLTIDSNGNWGTSSYKTLIGNISQSGTDSPVINEFYSTLGTTFTCYYDSTGTYLIELGAEGLLTGEIFYMATLLGFVEMYIDGSTTIGIKSYKYNGDLQDDILTNTPFEIRLYSGLL